MKARGIFPAVGTPWFFRIVFNLGAIGMGLLLLKVWSTTPAHIEVKDKPETSGTNSVSSKRRSSEAAAPNLPALTSLHGKIDRPPSPASSSDCFLLSTAADGTVTLRWFEIKKPAGERPWSLYRKENIWISQLIFMSGAVMVGYALHVATMLHLQ